MQNILYKTKTTVYHNEELIEVPFNVGDWLVNGIYTSKTSHSPDPKILHKSIVKFQLEKNHDGFCSNNVTHFALTYCHINKHSTSKYQGWCVTPCFKVTREDFEHCCETVTSSRVQSDFNFGTVKSKEFLLGLDNINSVFNYDGGVFEIDGEYYLPTCLQLGWISATRDYWKSVLKTDYRNMFAAHYVNTRVKRNPYTGKTQTAHTLKMVHSSNYKGGNSRDSRYGRAFTKGIKPELMKEIRPLMEEFKLMEEL